MTASWDEVSMLLRSHDRWEWWKIAEILFDGDVVPGDWAVAERLMLRAESSLGAHEASVLMDRYLVFCARTGHQAEACDYLSDSEVLWSSDLDLVRRYVELAELLGRDAELCAGLDWLRAHGAWGNREGDLERALIRRQGDGLLVQDAPESQSAVGALRRFGQQIGLAVSGKRQSVLDLVPSDLPLQVAEAQVRRAAQPARRELARLLARTLDSTNTKVTLVGLNVAADELLWLGRLDATVLDAVRFASAGDPRAFCDLLDNTRWHAGGDLEGNLPRLAGYVAEQQTKMHLLQQGHQVEMPESPTQAGYDLLVDGQPVQVKHVASPAAIEEHRVRYPDTPVIANAEHADRYQDDPLVWIDPQRSYGEPYDDIDGTLEALHDFPIPMAAVLHLALAGIRHIDHADSWQGYGERVAKDAGANMAFTSGGAWLFSGVAGIALGPVGVAVAATLGAMIGSGIGDYLGKAWIAHEMGAKNDAVAERLFDLAQWAHDVAVPDKLDAAERECMRVLRLLKQPEQHRLPLAVTAFWRVLAEAQVKQLSLFADRLDERLAGSEADRIRAGWQVLQASGQIAHAGMRERVAALHRHLALLRA